MKKSVLIAIVLIIAVLTGAYFLNTDSPDKEDLWKEATYTQNTELGNGENNVNVEVKAGDSTVTFTIHTDKITVGDALKEHNLIDGEEGPYGLYVKVVNGIEADYDKDQSYWAFTKGGKSMQKGVDSTKFKNGEHYELVYTK